MNKKKTFQYIFKKHSENISDKWEQYPDIYEKCLAHIVQNKKIINLLEIGIQNGGSLQIWQKYLPKGSMIYGVDINKECLKIKTNKHLKVFIGDATKEEFIDKHFKQVKFDIIIDDASHINKDIIRTFEFLFPKLKTGGIYFIEDLHCSYRRSHGGGLHKKKFGNRIL